MKKEKDKSTFFLDSIQMNFKKGYDWEENEKDKLDRYEGMIKFKNGHDESFSFRLLPDMCENYIKLIADNIVKSASTLSVDLIKSLNLNK